MESIYPIKLKSSPSKARWSKELIAVLKGERDFIIEKSGSPDNYILSLIEFSKNPHLSRKYFNDALVELSEFISLEESGPITLLDKIEIIGLVDSPEMGILFPLLSSFIKGGEKIESFHVVKLLSIIGNNLKNRPTRPNLTSELLIFKELLGELLKFSGGVEGSSIYWLNELYFESGISIDIDKYTDFYGTTVETYLNLIINFNDTLGNHKDLVKRLYFNNPLNFKNLIETHCDAKIELLPTRIVSNSKVFLLDFTLKEMKSIHSEERIDFKKKLKLILIDDQ